jgi:hypothetical protein
MKFVPYLEKYARITVNMADSELKVRVGIAEGDADKIPEATSSYNHFIGGSEIQRMMT